MKQATSRSKTLIPLYLPLILAYIFSGAPVISYFIAWFGSLFIFYQTWFSPAVYFQTDLSLHRQVMRPIFLLHFIFAGFMSVTSIFYFLDHLGYRYLSEISYGEAFKESLQTALIAKCQRLCLLAHVGLVTGIILKIHRLTPKPTYKITGSTNYLIWLSLIVYILGSVCSRVGGLIQIAIPLMTVGISCAAVLFLKGVLTKNINFLAIGAGIFFLNLVHASLSGYKEPIIVNIIILAAVFFPYYKKTIIYLTIPVSYFILYFLPTYNSVIRASWSGEITAEAAQEQALETLIGNTNDEEIEENNWGFLTRRLSEIEMFAQFIEYVPEKRSFYGWEIINDSMYALIPRILWPDKPNIEVVSMERVYQAGVINPLSAASAKTRPVVDGYLSWGIPGVFIAMLLYGLLAQALCNLSEKIFGGYELGCVIVFNSLFQTMWRGNNFEFMFNNIFYAYIIMWILWWLLKTIKVISPVYAAE